MFTTEIFHLLMSVFFLILFCLILGTRLYCPGLWNPSIFTLFPKENIAVIINFIFQISLSSFDSRYVHPVVIALTDCNGGSAYSIFYITFLVFFNFEQTFTIFTIPSHLFCIHIFLLLRSLFFIYKIWAAIIFIVINFFLVTNGHKLLKCL